MATQIEATDLEFSSAERLVDAAKLCLLEDGAAHTSLKTIAARAGVNHGLIHRYFGSKETLMIAVLEDMDHKLPPLGFQDVGADASLIIDKIFKNQRIAIELLSLSYQMPALRQAFVRKTRKTLRLYVDQASGLEARGALRLGALLLGLSVYHAVDPKLPVRTVLEDALRAFGNYPDKAAG